MPFPPRLVRISAREGWALIEQHAAERDRRNVNAWMKRFDAAKRRAA